MIFSDDQNMPGPLQNFPTQKFYEPVSALYKCGHYSVVVELIIE